MFAFNITYLYIFLTFSVIYEWALIMTCLLGLELGALKFDAACQLYNAVHSRSQQRTDQRVLVHTYTEIFSPKKRLVFPP